MAVATIWQIFYWGWVAGEVFIAVATRTKSRSGKVQDRGSQLLLWIVIFASLTACEVSRRLFPANTFGGTSWLETVAVILLAAAIIFRLTAIIILGKAFSANVAIKDSQRICKAGPYRFLRHPSYLGLLLVFLAIGIHSRNWLNFAEVMVPTTIALVYRIAVEEKALRAAFGEEYITYSRATWRIIPGVY